MCISEIKRINQINQMIQIIQNEFLHWRLGVCGMTCMTWSPANNINPCQTKSWIMNYSSRQREYHTTLLSTQLKDSSNHDNYIDIGHRRITISGDILTIGSTRTKCTPEMIQIMKLFQSHASLYPDNQSIDQLQHQLGLDEEEMSIQLRKLRLLLRNYRGILNKKHSNLVEAYVRDHPALSTKAICNALATVCADISKVQLRGLVEYMKYKTHRKRYSVELQQTIKNLMNEHHYLISKKLYDDIETQTGLPRYQIRRIVKSIQEGRKRVPLTKEIKQVIQEIISKCTTKAQALQELNGKVPITKQQIRVYLCKHFLKTKITDNDRQLIRNFVEEHHDKRKIEICDMLQTLVSIPRIQLYIVVTSELKRHRRKNLSIESKTQLRKILRNEKYKDILQCSPSIRYELLSELSNQFHIPPKELLEIISSMRDSLGRKPITAKTRLIVQQAWSKNRGEIPSSMMTRLEVDTGLKRSQIRYLISRLNKNIPRSGSNLVEE